MASAALIRWVPVALGLGLRFWGLTKCVELCDDAGNSNALICCIGASNPRDPLGPFSVSLSLVGVSVGEQEVLWMCL